ncbi:DMT family transporter [Sphingobium sp. CCH11-B1]|jgi:S-adenosylmethionine uptake transporter|uniref:DMT family transporter n=1 Tax=Sphingobium sp. CCH11-B1 TaxID=1768781 RepID=UPI000830D495|nr:DMT family transporter [Sphingobium sp. CCH11-B1]MEA3390760.1 DMT family transporter [Pseudomonadota bacterium]
MEKPARGFAIPFAVCCLGVALFSVMDAAMKGLSLSIGLYNALFWRAVAGTLLGFALMLLTRQRWPTAAVLRIHLLRGSVVAAMAALFFWAIMRLPLAEAIALSFIAPLIALYLAALLLKEKVGRQAIGASLLGLVGVGVILSGRLQGHYAPDALLGALAVLASAVLFAWNLVIQRQQAQLATPIEVAFFQHLVMLGVFVLGAPVWLTIPPVEAAPLVLLAALLAFTSLSALAWAYARSEAQRLIPVEYSAFLWAAIVGWLAFGERVTPATVAGALLIVAGCLIAARSKRPDMAHVEAGTA